MLNYNTMRFLTDSFNPFIKQALLVSSEPVDLSDFNRLDQITVLGSQPEGSKRRFLFKMNNAVYKFDGQNLVEYTGTVNLDNVLDDGNTAAQIEAVRSNRQLVGQKIYPIIALYSEGQDTPSAKLSFQATNAVEELDFNKEHSPMYFHDENVDPSGGRVDGTILGFGWDVDTNGDAQAGFKVQLLQNGDWTNYLTLTEAKGQTARGVRAKWYYHVDAANATNSVKIKKFKVYWSPETNFNVYGDTAYLTSTVKNFGLNLQSCVLVVRYEPLDGGNIQAHASFQSKRKSVSGEELGYKSSGIYQTAHKFLPSTLKVFVNGNRADVFDIIGDNQHFKVAESQWATAPYSVSCDYQYDADDEIWLEMTADDPEPTDNGLYTSRFFIKNPYGSAKQLAAIRLTINRGRDTKSTTRTATGSAQSITFSKIPDNIECDADDWSFDDDTNTITFTAPEGQTVNVSYDWHGQTPVLRGWQAAFATA